MTQQKIKVTRVNVPTDPVTEVFQIEITPVDDKKGGVWCEVLNTAELLNAFLRGLRVATSQVNNTFNMESAWVFDKESCIDRLP